MVCLAGYVQLLDIQSYRYVATTDLRLLCPDSQCAGVVVSPANAAYTGSELNHQIKDSGSKYIFCAPQLLPIVLEATAHWGEKEQAEKIVLACRRSESEGDKLHKCLDDLMGKELLDPHVYKDPTDELAYLCYSSGTTGLAKGVMTTVYNMTR